MKRAAAFMVCLAAAAACMAVPCGSLGGEEVFITACAEEEESDYIIEDIGGGNGRIIMYTGLEDKAGEGVSLTIPDTIDGLRITGPGDGAFMELPLTSVVIPEGVTEIGRSCFFRCSALAEISIPSSVKKIGGNAFSSTEWLEEQSGEDGLVIVNGILVEAMYTEGPVSVPVGVTEICENAFSLSNATDVALPEGLRCIRKGAFCDCRMLQSVGLPKSIVLIEEDAFLDCPQLDSVTFPKKLNNICDHAFGFSYDSTEDKYIRNEFEVVCYEGSGAQAYAENYGFSIEFLEGGDEEDDTETDNLLGDVDLDGEITIVDAVGIINDINGVTPLDSLGMAAADVNGDGIVAVDDAVAIISHINGLKAIGE